MLGVMSEGPGGPPLPVIPARVGRLAMIARWKPVHAGHAAVLEELAERADHVVIGIGSANRYDARNPFTAAETAEMLRLVLAGRDHCEIVEVPDLDDGPRWRVMVRDMLGPLDLFVTANGYVRGLLLGDYPILHPVQLVAPERRVRVEGAMVRRGIARRGAWEHLVAAGGRRVLSGRGLVARFARVRAQTSRSRVTVRGDIRRSGGSMILAGEPALATREYVPRDKGRIKQGQMCRRKTTRKFRRKIQEPVETHRGK